MGVRTIRETSPEGAAPAPRQRYNAVHGAAIIAHGLSYMTTLWFVQWVWPAGDLVGQSAVACTLEALLFGMKSALWNGAEGDDGVGFAGVAIDGLINAGGLLPQAGAILTFPPIAIVLSLVKIRTDQLTTIATLPGGHELSAAGLVTAVLGGILLSAAPHRLWRAASRRKT